MASITPLERDLEVSKERREWTKINRFFKQFFFEKIYFALSENLNIERTKIPIIEYYDDETISDELSYSGIIKLLPSLIGGYAYEYIYDADTVTKEGFFSATEDVDITILIPDIFSTEMSIIDIEKLKESGYFFEEILSQIIGKIDTIDFSELEYLDKLDELPEKDDEYELFYDKQKIRLIVAERNTDKDFIFQKIQIKISKEGIYNSIADVMVIFNTTVKTQDTIIINKKCYDGVNRDIVVSSPSRLLSTDFEALIERYKYPESITKTRNHIGRILFLLIMINNGSDELLKYSAKTLCEFNIKEITKRTKKTIKNAVKTVLCNYKGVEFTFEDLLLPIKDYALSKYSPRFLEIFVDR